MCHNDESLDRFFFFVFLFLVQEKMLRVQLCNSHGKIHEKYGLILSLQHEFDHNQALLQAKTLRHTLELERAKGKAQEFVVEQECNSCETKLKA
jgi:hypothetical protein